MTRTNIATWICVILMALGVIVPSIGAILNGTADTLSIVCCVLMTFAFGAFIGIHIPDSY